MKIEIGKIFKLICCRDCGDCGLNKKFKLNVIYKHPFAGCYFWDKIGKFREGNELIPYIKRNIDSNLFIEPYRSYIEEIWLEYKLKN